ncbi:MAG: HlyC/CorC family transporter [Gammaproteobacteria bacterium]|nr:HlyC/CorC family transporter [Gammaproteobacteria bacterium]
MSDIYLLIIFIVLSIGVSFLCSIAEAVLLSISPGFIEHRKQERPRQARLLARVRVDNIDQSLAAILTLNTIAHTVGAIVAGAKATQVFGSAWIGAFSAAMTLAILLLSEIIPKTIGAVYWKRLAPSVAVFINGIIKLLYPLIWISEKITRWIARDKEVPVFNRDEFIAMADVGEGVGDLEAYELRVIKNLFQFESLTAADVMTPRTVLTGIAQDSSIEDAYKAALKAPFSRFPLYDTDIDQINGFALKDDIFRLQSDGQGQTLVSEIKREMSAIFANKNLAELLEAMIDQKQHIALVVDEYGATKGLVTMEDIVETLLGVEIMDEVDRVEDMQRLAKLKWKLKAKNKGIELED